MPGASLRASTGFADLFRASVPVFFGYHAVGHHNTGRSF